MATSTPLDYTWADTFPLLVTVVRPKRSWLGILVPMLIPLVTLLTILGDMEEYIYIFALLLP
jgi:hypothetical protein